MLKVQFKRRVSHEPNLTLVRKLYSSRSFALETVHERCDV